MNVPSGTDGVELSGGAYNTTRLTGETFNAAQYSQTKYNSGTGLYSGPAVRCQTGANTSYHVETNGSQHYLSKCLAGGQSSLAGPVTQTFADNDWLRLEVEEITGTTTLRVYRALAASPTSFTLLATYTDTASPITTAGAAGFFGYGSGVGLQVFTAWEAGNLGAPPSGPTIDTQPKNKNTYPGEVATFTVAATTSGGSLSYQWKFNGSNVGTNSTTYTRTTVIGDELGLVTCDVTDDNGTTTTNAALLRVFDEVQGALFIVGDDIDHSFVGGVAAVGGDEYSTGGPAEVFGTLNLSLAPVTLGGTGSVSVAGALNGSMAALTLSGTGSVSVAGALNGSMAALTLSGTGSVSVAGTLNATLAAVTASASGTVANAGTLNATLAAATVSAAGTVSNTGTLNATLGAVTLSADGTVGNGVTGTLSQTLGAVTLSGAGTVNVSGTLTQTLGAVTASASGSVSVTGTLSSTLAAVTLSATGSASNSITGTLNATLGTLTASSSGSVSITGTLNRTLANVTMVSAGSVLVTGNLNVTLDPVTLFTGGIPDTWSGGSSRIGGTSLYNQNGRIGATVMASQQGRIGR